jgi:ABC-type sugar transport system permease subunit
MLGRNTKSITGLFFVAPGLLLIILFYVYPMVNSFFYSFTDYDLLSKPVFIGFKNYIDVFKSPDFYNSLRVSFIYVFGTVIPVWFFSFVAAYCLEEITWGSSVFRTLIFLPTVLPLVSITLIWKLILNYNGFINSAIMLPLFGKAIPWLTDVKYAPLALIITSWWHAVSYYMVLLLAGLQSIPKAYYDAAEIDGASRFKQLCFITVPVMKPTIAMVMVISIFNGFKTFSLQQIMTQGGPASSTEVLSLFIYKTVFSYTRMGRGCAVSILFFLIILCIGIFQLKIMGEE